MKILIVNNNMKVGGVQKSLCNLLWELDKEVAHQVTLLLFDPDGAYMESIPTNVKCICVDSAFRYLGTSQSQTRGMDKLKRGFFAATTRLFGRSSAVRLMLGSQEMLPEQYDCAIAFLHNGTSKAFTGGVQEFVLERVQAAQKIAFIHGDYRQNGANDPINNQLLERFDKIAVCSEGCGEALRSVLPQLSHKICTVRNCNNIDQIRALAQQAPMVYDAQRLNVLCVARLSATKGVDRAIHAVNRALAENLPVTLHIVGSGAAQASLKTLAKELGIEENVRFYGNQANPYRYMVNGDLLLLTSYHEAAPMVIDEAYILGIPTLTTKTSSSEEMVTRRNCGWVCENNQQDLEKMLLEVLREPETLAAMKKNLKNASVSNAQAMDQFAKLLNQ